MFRDALISAGMSGSSITKTSDAVPSGTPAIASGGSVFAPSHVCSDGMRPLCSNADEVRVSAMVRGELTSNDSSEEGACARLKRTKAAPKTIRKARPKSAYAFLIRIVYH